jgi:Icc-related predicted phosphoesterase
LKIKDISDIHLEFWGEIFMDIDVPNNEGADVLILAGDIILADKAKKFVPWFERICSYYKNVIYIAGNHESYHYSLFKTYDKLKEYLSHIPNLHILEKETVEIDGVTFLGATLWSDMNRKDPLSIHAIQNYLNDYRTIRYGKNENYRKLLPQDTITEHYKTLEFLRNDLKNCEKAVVVTHHAPSFLSVGREFKDDYYINGGYSSDLSEFILDHPQIKLWFHGHHHSVSDYVIGETRVICNPHGYPGQDTGFDVGMAVEI